MWKSLDTNLININVLCISWQNLYINECNNIKFQLSQKQKSKLNFNMKKTYKFQSLLSSLIFLLLLSTLLPISRTVAVSSGVGCRHPPSQNSCKTCMVEQTNYGCPKCGPVLGCMARCLWGGVSQRKCTTTCGCDTFAKPSLLECKRCVSRCKCSCAA